MPLPLPLVPFEQYMLLDDRPAYPMSFFIRLHFSGRLNVSALQALLPTVLARHPLLRAVVRKVGQRFQWVASPSWPTIGVVSPGDGGRSLHPPAIDVRQEPGLRLWAVEDDQRFYLLLQFHHACCDALGSFVFLEDLLTTYARATGATPSLLALDEDSLQRRGRFGSLSAGFLQVLGQKFVELSRAWRFMVHMPVTIAPRDPAADCSVVPESYPNAHGRHLTVVESLRLREMASGQGVSLNDLLVRDWFLAVDSWKTQHFPCRPGDWLRLCVPISLRTENHSRLSAANVVSMVFLDRRAKDLAQPERLLQGIHREMDQIKRLRLGPAFIVGMSLVQRLPDRLVRAIGADRCWATGVLSNLGPLLANPMLPKRHGRLVVDGAVLEAIDFLPPLRPGTFAAFGAFTYAGQLGLTLHYDPRVIEPAQAENLIDAYVAQLRCSMRFSGSPRCLAQV